MITKKRAYDLYGIVGSAALLTLKPKRLNCFEKKSFVVRL
jgi:hypothetical protein